MGAKQSTFGKFKLGDDESIAKLGEGNLVRVSPSDKKNVECLVKLVAESFAGTEKTAPEGGVDFIYCGDERKGKHCNPLNKAPTPDRLAFTTWLARIMADKYVKYGSCFLLLDPQTKRPAVGAITAPPYAKSEKEESLFWDLLRIMRIGRPKLNSLGIKRMINCAPILFELRGKSTNGKHWYISMFATHPDYQGKGLGKKLLQLLGKIADANEVDTYLEATGKRNVGFYSKVEGYQVRCSLELKNGKEVFDEDGGIHGMLRPKKQ